MALDIHEWLEDLGLGAYAEAFDANDIDGSVLPDLTADDLKDIGVTSVGHRRRLLSAIAKLSSDGPIDTEPAEASAPTPVRSEAERRQLTVMFVDLVGSTELSGRLDPEDLRALMQRYQAAVTEAIRDNHGYLANWLGDGAIAYFGWPSAGEDQALQAVRAGLDAVEAVGRLPLASGSAEMLAARVGIATGQVVVGDLAETSVGPERTVTGETPNLAARLQGVAAPGGVVIGRTTRALVGAAFELEFLGPQSLKGFSQPVEAWAVRAAHEAETRFEAPGGRLTTFTGRAHEVGLLLDRWTQAQDGDGQVVLVSGEPGIGKSRIVRAFRDRIEGDRYRQILYQCSPHHVNSARRSDSSNSRPVSLPAMRRKPGSTGWKTCCAKPRPTFRTSRRFSRPCCRCPSRPVTAPWASSRSSSASRPCAPCRTSSPVSPARSRCSSSWRTPTGSTRRRAS